MKTPCICRRNVSRPINRILCFLLTLLLFLAMTGFSAFAKGAEAYHQYMVLRAQMLQALGAYETWPLESRAELDQFSVDIGLRDESDKAICDVPRPDELSLEEALELARAAILAEHGEEILSWADWEVSAGFYRMVGNRLWAFDLTPKEPTSEYIYHTYFVELHAQSGEIERCASLEHIGKSPLGTAEPPPEPDLPGSDNISREEAFHIGQPVILALMEQREGWSEAFPPIYETHAEFCKDFSIEEWRGDAWLLSCGTMDEVVGEYFGTFWVVLDAQTGNVVVAQDSTGTNG